MKLTTFTILLFSYIFTLVSGNILENKATKNVTGIYPIDKIPGFSYIFVVLGAVIILIFFVLVLIILQHFSNTIKARLGVKETNLGIEKGVNDEEVQYGLLETRIDDDE